MVEQEQLDQLIAHAERWAADDIDDLTRAEATRLLEHAREGDEASIAELEACFSDRLAFGTAGLRGKLGPGPSRMNRIVVSQTSAGFAAFLLARAAAGETTSPPSVVIGYDARVNSDVFAKDAAEIMAGAGVRVILLPQAGPTPLTAFAVRHLGVSAGVMVTASHNPPRDNGYKVYLGDSDGGSQIVPPADADIAKRILEAASQPVSEFARSDKYEVADEEIANAYVQRTAAALVAGFDADKDGAVLGSDTPLTVVYTAMHGVGAELAQRVFLASGLPKVTVVAEQVEPDGNFPTVDFPNPEEPGALDLAIRTANETEADLIVAHDPDADRLAIAVPHPDAEGGYRRLTGNELGLLLGWRAAERAQQAAELRNEEFSGSLACTIVSSPALGAVAREFGLDYAETLSGFKWVSRVPNLIFGFEEALGYLTHPDVVRDKDGISASGDAIAMVRECKARGIDIWGLLDEAAELFGHFSSTQVTLRLDSMAAAADLSSKVRDTPPTSFGVRVVETTQDLLEPGLAEIPSNVLRYDLSDGSRVMIRPSGTEPKLKVYLDTFSDRGNAAARRSAAESALAELETDVRSFLDKLQ
ncbi:phospho-sugar mutase [Leucobacter denitrificans]|uniref:Phospho-sugar mutase n=2 Tax=Leucobacter denitrificans TaxID=683042 RepID=A0A7G9S7V1_9MICO|nr:phospho-sugar mutase [Leucobacter denitrificans]